MMFSNENSDNWKDRYHELAIDRNQLAKKLNDTETSLRMVKTKQAKLESLVNKHTIDTTRRPSTAIGKLLVSEKQELEDLLDDTQKKYTKSLKDIRILEYKQKESLDTIEKSKREIGSLRRRLAATMPHAQIKPSQRLSVAQSNRHCKFIRNTNRHNQHDVSIQDVYRQYERFSGDEANENDTLTKSDYLTNCNNLQKISQLETELKTSRIQQRLLQTKYDNLVSKEKMMLESAIEQVEEYSNVIHDLRVQLHELQIAKIKSDQAASYSKEQKEQIEELTRHNQALEERLIELYENPLHQELKYSKINEKIEFVNEIGALKIKHREKDYEIATLKATSNTIKRENLLLTARLSESEKILNKTKNLIDEPLLKILEGVSKQELAKALAIVRSADLQIFKDMIPQHNHDNESNVNEGVKLITPRKFQPVAEASSASSQTPQKDEISSIKRRQKPEPESKNESEDETSYSENTNYSTDF